MEYLKEKVKLVSIVTKAIKDHEFSIQDFRRLLQYRSRIKELKASTSVQPQGESSEDLKPDQT